MPRVTVVADDLTGATDTGHSFAVRGAATRVAVRPESAADSTVRVVNTDSRYADPRTAAERVTEAVDGFDGVVYDKVDSTLRGNVVAEADAIMDATDARFGIVAPAAPELGRVTAGGQHLVDGRLLTDTEYADDANGPTTTHLPTLFSGSAYPVVHLDIGTVASGTEAVAEAFAAVEPDRAFVVCDVTHQRHLATIARAGASLDERVVYVGSAGLAEAVVVPDGPGELVHESPATEPPTGGALGIVGSVSETTLRQLAALPDDQVLSFDPETLLADPDQAGFRIGERAVERLANGESTVVTAARDRSAVEQTLALGHEADLTESEVRDRVTCALAGSARRAIECASGLFVTGGDVAMAVLDALDAAALVLSGEAVETGIPRSRIAGGPADGLPVVTKAGGFGSPSTVINCLESLRGDDD
ncbi:four-carbon acid sugar kinase family protein [Halococcus hamelinensis]|uniref:YgbK domain-containing protein n=1 Tax=Halococcus hamelinensis 100A6 TaxID=1132509 RepID=M0LYZ6_9EURY|nr:four-carbon acid sugar kinase family protein [Halococcus hamelinensis]EMA38666.1 ygbK domain-containing protein [Halococcus hamelinensis 100A6]